MTLFPEEKIVTSSDNGEIILTTHRIWQKTGGISSSQTKSIMLEHITSCQTQIKSNYSIIIIGILLIAGSIFYGVESNGMQEIVLGLSIIGLVLVFAFFWSRKNQIIISSPTANILINTSGMNQFAVEGFIDKVESTKHKRLTHLSKK